jgi:hypothetical protein
MTMEARSFITFEPLRPNPNTKVWGVVAKDGGATLGKVKWFGRWRKYAFFAEADTVFEQVCLRDIANFCETETKRHRLL